MNVNGETTISTEQTTLEIYLKGDSIEVFGVRIDTDDIQYGESHFSGSYHNYLDFRFEPDSIYISTYSGGLGGGTNTYYTGRKIN